MEHRNLARTGMKVTPLALGTMMFGAAGNPDHDDSIRIIHAALDAGINFVDTADIYSKGESEEIVGKALAGGRRDNVILASKAFRPMADDPNSQGGSRRWLFEAVENSLRRLKTDWIDLFQVHRFDPDTDLEETLGALDDLVKSGKVRYIGTSTYPVQKLVEAQWVSESRNLNRFVTEQPPYSILTRGVENEILPAALEHDISVIPWSPLSGGWLSGIGSKIADSRRGGRFPELYDLSIPANAQKLEAAEALQALADQAGISLIHLALAFVIRHPAVTSALIGPRTMAHLESQIGASEVELDEAVLDRIDEIVAPGVNLNPDDAGWQNPGLEAANRRRPGRAPAFALSEA